jgi:hypothetical protein
MVEKNSSNTKKDKIKSWRHQRRSIIINNEVSKFTKAFKENFITLIVSALGLVAALSWNDAIKTAIATLFPESDLLYKFYVAVVVTTMAVIITYFLSRIKTNGKT